LKNSLTPIIPNSQYRKSAVFGRINRTGRDPSDMLRTSFGLTGAVVLGIMEFESSGFVRKDV